jgi:hypothetical protein
MTGGIGDCIVAIGGSAVKLSSLGAICSAVVRSHQLDLISKMLGVTDCVESQKSNRLDVQAEFDVWIDFSGVFNSATELRRAEYYKLVGERLGLSISPGKLMIPRIQGPEKTVALHPSASNPNRRWCNGRWTDLAYELTYRGFRVVWLGTRDEFGFNDSMISKISDDTSNLVEQSRSLASADYFIGCDSGFAHVAGVLGVPGLVLFGNTHPDDVIAQYPLLKGVHTFDSHGDPTRSLRPGCLKSAGFMESLTVSKVLMSTPFDCLPRNYQPRNMQKSKRLLVGLKGDCREFLDMLESRYDLTDETHYELCDVLVEFGESLIVRVQSGRRAVVRRDNPESLVRAIRELYEAENRHAQS